MNQSIDSSLNIGNLGHSQIGAPARIETRVTKIVSYGIADALLSRGLALQGSKKGGREK